MTKLNSIERYIEKLEEQKQAAMSKAISSLKGVLAVSHNDPWEPVPSLLKFETYAKWEVSIKVWGMCFHVISKEAHEDKIFLLELPEDKRSPGVYTLHQFSDLHDLALFLMKNPHVQEGCDTLSSPTKPKEQN